MQWDCETDRALARLGGADSPWIWKKLATQVKLNKPGWASKSFYNTDQSLVQEKAAKLWKVFDVLSKISQVMHQRSWKWWLEDMYMISIA
jgi:hypothetical protein